MCPLQVDVIEFLELVSSVIVACIEKGAMGATGLYHCM